MKREASFLDSALPRLDPIIAVESDERGWRGLTACGEILEVRGANGHRAEIPVGDVVVMHAGKPVGRRAIEPRDGVSIDEYLARFNSARDLHRASDAGQALAEVDRAAAIASTWCARFNRSQILLACGDWLEGLDEYAACEREPAFMRPVTRRAFAAGLRQWRGEPVAGKRLLLLHDHGFGDTIMTLRYVPTLHAMGAVVAMVMPPELRRLALQLGPVVDDIQDADYFCTMLGLLGVLRVTPENVLTDVPYLIADPDAPHFRRRRKSVGIAWSVGKQSTDGDYPREAPLELLVERLGRDADLVSLQVQGCDQAHALGVQHSQFRDFDELTALMTSLDQVVSVDTAALHLAGAIGHPCVVGLLSHWHSWRWQANWYPGVRLRRQASPGDWASALP